MAMSHRNFPLAVHYPVGRPAGVVWLLGSIFAVATAVIAAWVMQPQAGVSRLAAAVLGWLLASGCLWHARSVLLTGALVWDGSRWLFRHALDSGGRGVNAALSHDVSDPVVLDALAVRADGQRWLWLEVRIQADLAMNPAGAARVLRRLSRPSVVHYLCLQQTLQPERWGDIRRAVYFPAKPLVPSSYDR
jgi:hypothetical protein